MMVMLIGMALIADAREKQDSLILSRIYQYRENQLLFTDSIKENIYTKFRFNIEKRNSTLWLIPTMYVFAKGDREYIREVYSQATFTNAHDYDIERQVQASTIRRNRGAMPTLLDFITPNIYDVALYDGYILSPFSKTNRKYYRFRQTQQSDGTTRLDFHPKLYNTQLLNGYAIVETETGRIIRTLLNGEFDMITFRTEIQQSEKGDRSLMPLKSKTAATFRFAGNRIATVFDVNYDCPAQLPDSISRISSREMMDSLRPTPLSETDKDIYKAYDERTRPDTTVTDSTPKKTNLLKKIFWDTIGDNLVTPIAAENGPAYFRLSPIINPLYLSYSHSRGLAYKIRLRSRYTFSAHRYLTLNPTFGYNFKQTQFYFTAPLRMTYNPKRNGYAEIVYGNGNRISNSSVMDAINHEHQDTINFDDTDMDKFRDYQLRVFNNIMLFDWLDIESGFVYHRRTAINGHLMREYGMPDEYRSFAPMLGFKFSPWLDRGPVFSIDWERGIKGVNHSDIDYERWEIDASWKRRIPGLRVLNLRAGGGFYSRRAQNYFVDFANFRDNNLPEGWDDDWSGNYQLLRSRIYNQSDYYVRGNISYESPMMFATWVPYLGKYLEKERLYVSSVLLDDSRPYFEFGYGFTNRYISIGLFASFQGTDYQRAGVRFDFELFKRW